MKKKIALLMACTMAAASLAGCGGGNTAKETTAAAAPAGTTAAAAGETTAAAAPAGDVAMTMFWWGNQIRNERTQAALDLYSETNGVKLDGQFAEWSDYWNKLATSAAGHAMPDVVQMDYMYLDQYAKSGLLVDLKPYIENGTLDVSQISENTIASGSVGDGVYAIAAGINSPALLYNKTLLDGAGITVKDNMTMDEFFALCKEVYEKTGVKTNISYGSVNSWSEYFMRSYDIVPFGDKCMNGDETSWTPFFEMYTTGLSEGWMLDPSVFAEITVGSVEQTPMVYGQTPDTQSWCEFYNSNQLSAMQKAAPEGTEIGITTWPSENPQKSNFLKPSQFFAVSRDAGENEAEAVKVVNYLLNSEDANKILLGERGVPASSVVASAIAPLQDETAQVVTKYVNDVVTPNCSAISPAIPDGANEVYDYYNQLVDKILYGQMTAEDLFKMGNQIMSR